MKFKIKELLDIWKFQDAKLIFGNLEDEISKFSYDSRIVSKSSGFFALKGEKVNGHDFVEDAFKNGAKLGIIEKSIPVLNKDFKNLISVSNTKDALYKLGKISRDSINSKVIAITGSSGKTTTKEFLYSILSKKFKTFKNIKNYNTDLSVSLALTNLVEDYFDWLVFEIAAQRKGEIALLTQILTPDIGVITHIGEAHMEYFGKTIEDVAQAKLELIDKSPDETVFVLNRDDPFLYARGKEEIRRTVFYGFKNDAEIQGKIVSSSKDYTEFYFIHKDLFTNNYYKSKNIRVNFTGEHYIYDILASIGATLNCGIEYGEIEKTLGELKPVDGRGNRISLPSGSFIIDETYNANPSSVKAAIKSLYDLKISGMNTVLVLGDMYELGDNEDKFHFEAGQFILKYPPDYFFAIGLLSKNTFLGATSKKNNYTKMFYFEKKEEAGREILKLIKNDTAVLLKASRGFEIETIIKYLLEEMGKK